MKHIDQTIKYYRHDNLCSLTIVKHSVYYLISRFFLKGRIRSKFYEKCISLPRDFVKGKRIGSNFAASYVNYRNLF